MLGGSQGVRWILPEVCGHLTMQDHREFMDTLARDAQQVLWRQAEGHYLAQGCKDGIHAAHARARLRKLARDKDY